MDLCSSSRERVYYFDNTDCCRKAVAERSQTKFRLLGTPDFLDSTGSNTQKNRARYSEHCARGTLRDAGTDSLYRYVVPLSTT